MAAWYERAACLSSDAGLFDAIDPLEAAGAVSYCRSCPVREACAGQAKDGGEWGVWGGLVWRDGQVVGRGCVRCGLMFAATHGNQTVCQACRAREDRERQERAALGGVCVVCAVPSPRKTCSESCCREWERTRYQRRRNQRAAAVA